LVAAAGATPALFLQQGCVGDFAPLSAMVLTATFTPTVAPPTNTPTLVPTPSYPGCTNATTPPQMIDDVETTDNAIILNQCRNGYWYNYNDGTAGGTQSITYNTTGVDITGTGTSVGCVRVQTNNLYTNWGSGFGFSFTSPQANYDAYGYNGIRLHARNMTGALTLKLMVTDDAVVNAVPAYSIGPHRVLLNLNTTWTLYQVTMAALIASPNDYAGPTVFDPSRIQQVQFAVGAGTASDVQIDNITFY
jgi:hypothetical protein